MASLNAGPEYYAAEEKYRNAKTNEEKLEALKEMLSKAPKHKAAESLLKEIKTKIAKLRKEIEKGKKGKKGGAKIFPKKHGVQACIIGFENSGKTKLLNLLAGTHYASTSIAFETQQSNLGVVTIKKAKIQFVDTPSITKENIGLLKGFANNADLIMALVKNEEEKKFIEKNFKKEKILFKNKEIFEDLEKLKEEIYKKLGIIRVFTKSPREAADYEEPIVLKKGEPLKKVAEMLKKKNAKFAKVWGSTKFPGQQVGMDYRLKDGDVVEIHEEK